MDAKETSAYLIQMKKNLELRKEFLQKVIKRKKRKLVVSIVMYCLSIITAMIAVYLTHKWTDISILKILALYMLFGFSINASNYKGK